MPDDLDMLRASVEAAIAEAADPRALDAVRVAALGKSGEVTALLKALGALPPEERRARGAEVNVLKGEIERALENRRVTLEAFALDARLAAERMDMSLPPRPHAPTGPEAGSIHPISRTMEELIALFGAMGFAVAEGPDIEGDWHNFSALNIPEHHPARQDHDTFYLTAPEGGRRPVLRTHTSRCRSAPC
jgi:phenylalanyl-tRNA synthetase alpha chain